MITRTAIALAMLLYSVQLFAQTTDTDSQNTTGVSEESDMPPAPFAEDAVRRIPESSATSYQLIEQGPLISLERAHQLAKKNNPNFHNVEEQVYQSETLIRSAWAMLLPNLSANGKIIRNKNDITMDFAAYETLQVDPTSGTFQSIQTFPMTIQEKWQYALGFTANITLFNARSIPLIQNAYDSVEQSRLQAQIARNDMLFAVTSLYYQTANLKELVYVYAENVAMAEESLRMAEARMMVGQGTRIDVMRAKIQVKDSQRTLSDSVDAYKTAKRSMALMLGIKGDFQLILPHSIDSKGQSETELTRTAMENRIELRSAEMDVVMAERSRTETKTKWIPTFDATWQLDVSSDAGFTGDNTNWMLIFAANWSILEGGARFAELDKRKSQIRMAQNKIESLKLEIEIDVAQKYQEKVSKERNLEVSGELVELAQENYDMVSRQYEVGMANSLELTDASSELANKKVMLALAKLEYELALLTLGNTIGEYNSLALK
ncbi:MAG: TolC family protein [Deltaproteobacteria bacterium]|nr:TolC family protein [Deltaproteobacteria bacterium]MBN2670926.1 TolC family protein [Deltaproteobacteria bacterium]